MKAPRPPVVLVEYLLDLVTAEHNQQPRYMATVALSVEPFVDGQNTALSYPTLFDLDTSVGQQEDMLGEWVGVTRYIVEPVDIFFTLDKEGLGFDQGKWQTPYELAQEVVRLDDEHYRILLRARIVANYWDGTIPGAYKAWDILFKDTSYEILIQNGLPGDERFFTFDDELRGFDQARWWFKPKLINDFFTFDSEDLALGFDRGRWYSAGLATYEAGGPVVNGNMHLIQALIGPPMDAVMLALFTGGYLGLKSAGVEIDYVTQYQEPDKDYSVGRPLFALDCGPNGEGYWVSFDIAGCGHDEAPLFYPGAYPYLPHPLFTFDGNDLATQFDAGYWSAPQEPDYFTFDSPDASCGFDYGEWFEMGAIDGEPWYPPPWPPDEPLPATGVTQPPVNLAGFDLGAWAWKAPEALLVGSA